jgi:hypothetical protein
MEDKSTVLAGISNKRRFFARYKTNPADTISGTLESGELFASINLGDVGQEVQDTSAVSPLIVVPADQLDEVLVERDTGLGVKDGRVGVTNQISRDNLVLGVGEDTYTALARSELHAEGGARQHGNLPLRGPLAASWIATLISS